MSDKHDARMNTDKGNQRPISLDGLRITIKRHKEVSKLNVENSATKHIVDKYSKEMLK